MASNGADWVRRNKRMKAEGGPQNNIYNKMDYDEEPRRKRPENTTPNHILLFTVINPSYPITTDILYKICKNTGNVVRIVVFKKNGVQAMIEFESQDEAVRTKEALNGADIYSGCCTLKIEFAKPTKLNVYKNDSDSWDYTQPALGMGGNTGGRPARPAPLLPEPPRLLPDPHGPPNMRSNFMYPNDDYFGSQPSGFEFEGNYNSNVLDKYINKPRGGMGSGDGAGPGGFGGRGSLLANDHMMGSGSGPHGGNSVLMVYELDPQRVNPDKVFNLFCLYGNVVKIKFLKTKEGCCMVQMGDALTAERALSNMNKTVLSNGKRLAVAMSKQAYLADVLHPYQLPDGTNSFQDFSGSRKNRYTNMKMAMKNRIQPPSKLLHFFNAPPDITEEQLSEVFTKAGGTAPAHINIFKTQPRGNDDKPPSSSSGLVEFDTLEDAVDAIMQANHASINSDAEVQAPRDGQNITEQQASPQNR